LKGSIARRGSGVAGTALLVCGLVLSLAVDARPKTDVIYLANGDRLTGEIKKLENGLLSYSTDNMGTVHIEWENVARADANYFFRVRTASGRRFFGTIDESTEPGKVRVLHAGGEESLAILDVVAITPIDDTLQERIDTTISVGYSNFKASDSSTLTAGVNVTYADEFSTNTLDARSVVTDNNDEVNKSQQVSLERRRLWDNPRNFTFSGAGWETNDELGIEYRVGLGFGLGRNFIDSNRTRLAITGGLQGLTEEDDDGATTESIEGLIKIDYLTWRFDTPELDLETSVTLYPGITESGRLRSDANISLSWEIIEDLKLNISAFGNYDNQSSESGDDYDFGITTGIDWEI